MLIPSQPYLAWNVDRLIVAPGAALNWISNVIGLRRARETLGCFTVITGAPDAGGAVDCRKCGAALSRISSSGVTSGHAMAHAPGRTDNAKAKVAIASLLFIGIFERSTRAPLRSTYCAAGSCDQPRAAEIGISRLTVHGKIKPEIGTNRCAYSDRMSGTSLLCRTNLINRWAI